MFATTLGCTYLGVVLFYVASSSAAPGTGSRVRAVVPPVSLRSGGLVLLLTGLTIALGTRPAGEAVLVWLSGVIAAGSLLVIAAPLVNRFVTVTGIGAVLFGLGGLCV